MKLSDVKAKNQGWFSRENMRFFGDVHYWLYHGRNGKHYLVRLTKAWSDMFARAPKYSYRINPIGDNGQIEDLIPVEFATLDEAKKYVKQMGKRKEGEQ